MYRIRAPRQIAALASPARQEVVDSLSVSGPASIAELACDLGRAPDSLYYHVRALERVGLVVRRGTRPAGVRSEVIYDVPGARMVIDREPSTRGEKQTLMRVVSAALRSAERELRGALDSGLAVYRRCKGRNAWAARVKGWLTPDELIEVREHLDAAAEILMRGKQRPGTRLHTVTHVLTPLEPTERSKAASSAKNGRQRR